MSIWAIIKAAISAMRSTASETWYSATLSILLVVLVCIKFLKPALRRWRSGKPVLMSQDARFLWLIAWKYIFGIVPVVVVCIVFLGHLISEGYQAGVASTKPAVELLRQKAIAASEAINRLDKENEKLKTLTKDYEQRQLRAANDSPCLKPIAFQERVVEPKYQFGYGREISVSRPRGETAFPSLRIYFSAPVFGLPETKTDTGQSCGGSFGGGSLAGADCPAEAKKVLLTFYSRDPFKTICIDNAGHRK